MQVHKAHVEKLRMEAEAERAADIAQQQRGEGKGKEKAPQKVDVSALVTGHGHRN